MDIQSSYPNQPLSNQVQVVRGSTSSPILIILMVLLVLSFAGNAFLGFQVFNLSNKVASLALSQGGSVGNINKKIDTESVSKQINSSPSPSSKSLQDVKNEVHKALTGYLNAVISNDRKIAVTYLTNQAKAEVNQDWPGDVYTYYKTFEVLNEFHSNQEELDFYNKPIITFVVKFYLKDDKDGKLTSIDLIEENDTWKTSTWNIFTSN